MASKLLDSVIVETGSRPEASVIWLHGLGADGHDFEPVVPELDIPDVSLRFVFPHAPIRPVTLNAGYAMRAWYDIIGIDRTSPQDLEGIQASSAQVASLIRRENADGIGCDRIVLAGFSQGGAVALYCGLRYPETLAGIIGLSTYLPHAADTEDERHDCNRKTPIFLAHGSMDPVVQPGLGESTRQLLEQLGYAVEWHSYPIPHSVAMEEIGHVRDWLTRVLAG